MEHSDAGALPFLEALRSWYANVLPSECQGCGVQLAPELSGLGKGHGPTMVLNAIY